MFTMLRARAFSATVCARRQTRCTARAGCANAVQHVRLSVRHARTARRAVVVQASKLADTDALPVMDKGEMTKFPAVPGVYAVFDKNDRLQYIGLSRKVSLSVSNHMEELPDLVSSVKVREVPEATREALSAAWREWVQEAVEIYQEIPPGNAQGNTTWQSRRAKAAKPEIKLTPGKGLQDLTCSVEDLIDAVVKSNKVVAFVKGTRMQPECGFSFRVLTALNEIKADFEVVNVLDEVYNPGLRDAIKTYSQWPTIPQVYVDGEFIGGADIVTEMHSKGELKELLKSCGALPTAAASS